MRREKKSLSILFILTLLLSLSFYSWTEELPIDKRVHYERICSFYSDRFFSWPAISNPQAAGLSATVIPESTPNSERGFEEVQPTPQGRATPEGEGNVISPGNSGDILPPTNTGVVAPPGNGEVTRRGSYCSSRRSRQFSSFCSVCISGSNPSS